MLHVSSREPLYYLRITSLDYANECRARSDDSRSDEAISVAVNASIQSKLRIREGDSPARIYRKRQGVSGAEVARRIGTSQARISEFETGVNSGSEATKAKLAQFYPRYLVYGEVERVGA